MVADEERVVRRDDAFVEYRKRRLKLSGRLVSPIIGRFWEYFTSGRSPFSKGRVTVAARLRADDAPNAPLASTAVAPRKTFRLVIICVFSSGHIPAEGKRMTRPIYSSPALKSGRLSGILRCNNYRAISVLASDSATEALGWLAG